MSQLLFTHVSIKFRLAIPIIINVMKCEYSEKWLYILFFEELNQFHYIYLYLWRTWPSFSDLLFLGNVRKKSHDLLLSGGAGEILLSFCSLSGLIRAVLDPVTKEWLFSWDYFLILMRKMYCWILHTNTTYTLSRLG